MNNFDAFDNFPYRLYVRDETKILYANKAVLLFFDKDEEDMIGKKFDEVFFDEPYIQHLKHIEKYFFVDENKEFSFVKELNRYYNEIGIYQIIEYLEVYNGKKVVVSVLINLKNEVYAHNDIVISAELTYNASTKTIIKNNLQLIQLTSLENSLIFLLANKKSQVVSYNDIFLTIDPFNKMNKVSLQSLIFRISKKIGNIILCVSMQGYYIK